jgi:hypothetical protein
VTPCRLHGVLSLRSALFRRLLEHELCSCGMPQAQTVGKNKQGDPRVVRLSNIGR